MPPTRRRPTRWVARSVGVLVAGAATVCAALPQASAAPVAHGVQAASPAGRSSVYLLGDSVFAGLSIGTALDGLRATYDVTLDAKVCRRTVSPSCTASGQTPDTGVETMRAHRGSLGDVLVVGLGYNDDETRFDVAIDALMAEAEAQHVPRVMWLTMRSDRYAAANAALRAAQARHASLLVVDWDAASAGHDDWFAADGLHLGSRGRTGLVAFIGEQLDGLSLARCGSGAPAVGREAQPPTSIAAPPDATIVDGRLQLTTPTRLLDTRTGAAPHPVGAGRVIEIPITGVATGTNQIVPADARAAIVNVTAVDACADGFLTVFPCATSVPTASNLNVAATGTVANLVTVALGGGRACIYSMVTTDVVVDLAGWYGPTGSTLSPIAPRRLIDTRIGTGLAPGAIAGGATVAFDVPAALGTSATGVAVNITSTLSEGEGFITAFACGHDRPQASNVNYVIGQVVSNMAIVPLAADGRLCFYAHARTHLVVDVFALVGVGDATTTTAVAVRSPRRIVDTRIALGTTQTAPGPLTAMHELTVPIDTATSSEVTSGASGTGAVLAVLNVTAVHPSGDGWLAAYPCGTTIPEISNLNFRAGSITPGHVVVAVGTSGSVCITAMVTTDVVVDLIGWLRATPAAPSLTTAAVAMRRLFNSPVVGTNRCTTRRDHRQQVLTLLGALDRGRPAIPWRSPTRAKAPAQCPVRA